jgi:hypothetical protein
MTRLGKWTTITLLLSTTLLGSAVLYGRTAPKSYLFTAQDVDLCDGELCFMGIVPGKTLWSDLPKQFQNDAVDINSNWFTVYGNNLLLQLKRGTDDSQNNMVEQVSAGGVTKGLLNFGYIIERFGTPCYSTNFGPQMGGVIEFEYPYFRIWVALEDNDLSFKSMIIDLTIYDLNDPNIERFCTRAEMASPTTPWLGFTTFERYKQAIDKEPIQ